MTTPYTTNVDNTDYVLAADMNNVQNGLSRLVYSVKDPNYGAVGDGSTDDTAAIQAVIDDLAALRGGICYLPQGTYKITDTITCKQGVWIVGDYGGPVRTGEVMPTKITFVPSTLSDNLFELASPVVGGAYTFGVHLENLWIQGYSGSSGTGNGIHFLKPGMCTLKNLQIREFVHNIWLDYCLHVTLEDVESRLATTTCLTIDSTNGLSTTVNIIRGDYRESDLDGIVLKTDAIRSLNVWGAVLESNLQYAVNQYEGNDTWWWGCYSENNPSTAAAYPIFRVGQDGTSTRNANDKGAISIIGGDYSGNNTTVHASSSFMDVDEAHYVYIGGGADIARVGNFMNTTANTKRIIFGGFTPITVTSMTGGFNSLSVISGDLPTSRNGGTHTIDFRSADRISFSRAGSTSMGYQIRAENFATDADLTFYQGGSTRVFRLDANGNVVIGSAALATNATNGFFYVSSSAGAPTGTPATNTGRVPMEVDTTNGRVYFYYGGAWHYATLT